MREVSVVVPTYGRLGKLEACLRSLGTEREVIVVDDGSPSPVPVGFCGARVIRQENRGPAAARNRGAAEARGDLVAFLDDDCVARPGWIERMLEAWAPGRLVGARVENLATENACANYNQRCGDTLLNWWMSRGGAWRFLPSSNMLVERSAFERLGGFSIAFRGAGAEDREFCGRWCDAGGTLHCVDARLVGHRHEQSVWQFAEMHFRYGRGAAILRRMRTVGPWDRELYRELRRAGGSAWLFGVSQAAALGGYAYEASRKWISSGRT
jgi:glycosyltransferase involved in cell wall biosynthesis